jgi:hypothetical protein
MPEPRDRLSVGQIALGVFLGNLMFGAVGAVSFCVMQDNARSDELNRTAGAQYEALKERERVENSVGP